MRKFIIIFIFILAIPSCLAQQNLPLAYPSEVLYKGDLAYFNGSPFTGILLDKKTNKKIGEFNNGYRDGLFIAYYENGEKKSECNYIKGQKDGIYREWFENKHIKLSYTYNLGRITDGQYVIYLENGQKESVITYKNGEIVNESKYAENKLIESLELSIEMYPNGNTKSRGYLKNGEREGLWTDWYETGKKKSEGSFKNGKKEGVWTFWFENGQKMTQGNYINGKPGDQWVSWFKDGKLNQIITAVMKTNMGTVEIELFHNKAPKLVDNFIGLANKNYYNGTIIWRVVDGTVINAGDPTGTGKGGESFFGGVYKNEETNDLKFMEGGYLSMSGDKIGSQFFITLKAAPGLNNLYTIFGKVTKGIAVLNNISEVKTDAYQRPINEIMIEYIKVEKRAKRYF